MDNQRQLGFSEAIQIVLNKYVDFTGRASRSEYWWWYLFTIIVSWGASIIGYIISDTLGMVLAGLASIALLLPSLGVLWRRLHDVGRSGVWVLLLLIPVVGAIVILVWLLTPSQAGDNKYGPEPYTFNN